MSFIKRIFGISTSPGNDAESNLKDQNTVTDSDNAQILVNIEEEVIEFDDKEKAEFLEHFVNEEARSNDFMEVDLRKKDDLFDEAARLVLQYQQGSTSLFQRKFSIGYNRSSRIIDQLEAAGILGPFEGSKARQVLIQDEKSLEELLSSISKDEPELIKNKLAYQNKLSTFKERYKVEIQQGIAERKRELLEEEDNYEKEKIKQKLLEKERKKRLHKEALQELIEEGEIFNKYIDKDGKRETIPQDVMDKVWNRDGGRCAKCGSQENLEFDHIIPFSKGGATTYRNIQLLCKKCNLEKSNRIG